MFELIDADPLLQRRFAPGAEPDFWDLAGARFGEYMTGEQAAILLLVALAAVLVASTLKVRADLRHRRRVRIARVDAARLRGREAARRSLRAERDLAKMRRERTEARAGLGRA